MPCAKYKFIHSIFAWNHLSKEETERHAGIRIRCNMGEKKAMSMSKWGEMD